MTNSSHSNFQSAADMAWRIASTKWLVGGKPQGGATVQRRNDVRLLGRESVLQHAPEHRVVPVPMPCTPETHDECVRLREPLEILLARCPPPAHRISEIAGNPLQDGRVQEEFSQRRRLGKEHLIGEVVGDDGVVICELRQP